MASLVEIYACRDFPYVDVQHSGETVAKHFCGIHFVVGDTWWYVEAQMSSITLLIHQQKDSRMLKIMCKNKHVFPFLLQWISFSHISQ